MPQPTIRRASRDSETTGTDFFHGAKPFFITTCYEDGTQEYWEADVDPETREPLWTEEDLDEIIASYDKADEWVFQNAPFDIRAEESLGIDHTGTWNAVVDTLYADHLLASGQRHDLTAQALRRLRVDLAPFETAIEKATKEARTIAKRDYPTWRIAKKGLPEMPSCKGSKTKKKAKDDKDSAWKFDMWLLRAIAKDRDYPEDHPWWSLLPDYANSDSAVTLPIYLQQLREMEERGLYEIYLERLKLLPALYEMEDYGMTASLDRLEESREKFTKEADKAHKSCLYLADYELETLPVNGRSNALTEVVFGKFNLKTDKKTNSGQPSMDKYVLEDWLAELDPKSRAYRFIKHLKGYRRRKTALSYLDSYEKFGIDEGDGVLRIHSKVNPTATNTLRSNSTNPNQQQVSKQEEVNARYSFGPAPGREWWSLDYANLELRIPAYEAEEPELIDLFERSSEAPYYGSEHLLNFSTVYPDLWEQVVSREGLESAGPWIKKNWAASWYQWCKNGDFAVGYGAIDRPDGTADKAFHRPGSHAKLKDRFARKEQLNQKYIALANRHGFVETLPDLEVDPLRGYPLQVFRGRRGVKPTLPLNYHVQGTACWIKARALVKCRERLRREDDCYIIADIHDELVFDLPYRENRGNEPLVRELAGIMESLGDVLVPRIPLKVGIDHHPVTWSESK